MSENEKSDKVTGAEILELLGQLLEVPANVRGLQLTVRMHETPVVTWEQLPTRKSDL